MQQIKNLWVYLESRVDTSKTEFELGESEAVEGCQRLRIGIDREKRPYVIYEHSVPDDRVPMDIDYKYVEIRFHTLLDLDKEGSPITCLFIGFKNKDDLEYQIVFKEALEGLMETIVSGSLTDQEVINRVEHFAELWNPKEQINEDELRGLWSELYFILVSKDKQKMLRAWHLNMNDKLDFTFDDGPDFELKSTIAQDRRHWFSHNQLRSRNQKDLVIVSMQLQRLAAGLTLDALHDELYRILGPNDKLKNAKARLHVAKIANNELYKTFCFDKALGKSSLRFYPCASIPSLDIEKHSSIKEVRYEIDLSSLKDNKKYYADIIDNDEPTI